MLSISFIFKIKLAKNVKQLNFEFGSRISSTKFFTTCTKDSAYISLCYVFYV